MSVETVSSVQDKYMAYSKRKMAAEKAFFRISFIVRGIFIVKEVRE
jgi:hypothetical protein